VEKGKGRGESRVESERKGEYTIQPSASSNLGHLKLNSWILLKPGTPEFPKAQ